MLYYLKLCYGRVSYLLSKLQVRVSSVEVRLNSGIDDQKVKEGLIRELATVRSLLTIMARLSALLEVLIVKVETYSTVGVTLKDLLVIKTIVRDLRGYTSSIPEISIIVEDMEDKVNDILHSLKSEYQSSDINEVLIHEEAKKIVEEANAIATLRLSNVKT